MGYTITYGEGGYCADCNPSHEHPLHNIISEVYVEETEPVVDRRTEILERLGLTEEEVSILLGDTNGN